MKFIRNLQPFLLKALTQSPVTLITGARQTGKTTLVKQLVQEQGYSYVTFDDLRFLSAAQQDPIGFIEGLPKPVILDEVQRVPEIFLPIKHDIDQNRHAGRYILTGSANPLLIPRLGDSLAGRMEILKMFPLSQGELRGVQESFIDYIFSDHFVPLKTAHFSKADFVEHVVIGGYPTVQGINIDAREAWFNGYLTTILQRDVLDLARIEGLNDLPHLLRILATRVGNLHNAADLSRSSGITTTTLNRYLTLLQTLFMIKLQPSWHSNLGKRLVKASKMYLLDAGLLCHLLAVDQERLHNDPTMLGPLFENFVVSELEKQSTWNKTRVSFFHFRSQTGTEVDILLESAAGKIVGIELKSGSTVKADDFSGLKHLQELLGEKFLRGIILYTGSEHVPFGKNLWALPVNSLWTPQV